MTVLMKLPQDLEGLPGSDAAAMECFRKFNSAYNDNASDQEAYLRQPDREEGAAEEMSFVDGRSEPDRIRAAAAEWNPAINAMFDAILRQLAANAPKDANGKVDWLGAPSHMVYEMKKAAVALDGEAHDFAYRALLVNDHEYPTSVIEPDQQADIQLHPDRYAILDVWPK